ncbi:MAG: M28 family metallopeptidase [Bacteroidales bacterium]|nr:M28 family metallopeptidase [Bacteroidales bacterium]
MNNNRNICRIAALSFAVTSIFSSQFITAQVVSNSDPIIENAIRAISSDSMRVYISDLLEFHTRHNLSSKNSDTKGIGAAAKYIEKRVKGFAKGKENFIKTEVIKYRAGGPESRLGREITLSNVITTIKGTSADDSRVIALLAHYDNRVDDNSDSTTYAPGANDNGSGVAALMEIARVLSNVRIPVTIKLMFLSGEEHGLLGAVHMADIATKEGWNLIAVLNNDMIGNTHSSDTDIKNNTLLRVFSENIPFTESEQGSKERVFNSSENDSPSRQLARYIKESGERYVLNHKIKLIYRNDRFGRGGDHTPFSRKGFTAIRLCEYYENYDRTHQKVGIRDGKSYGDIIEGVDFEYLRKNSAVNLATIMNLALAPMPPINVKTDISTLSNKTTISWRAPENGERPYGYYLLIRETDKSEWERKIFVKGESVEVPLSKDNYFFAVQSVSKNGNESLAQFSSGRR